VARCARNECGRRRPSALARLAGLGVYFRGAWYCGVRCLDAELRERATGVGRGSRVASPRTLAHLRLGVLLAHQVGLSRDTLAAALHEQTHSGLRLGAQLVQMGAATEYEILRALAAQAGVGFLATVDASWPRPGIEGLEPDAVRALGLVPLEVQGGVIRVACAAPLPHLALASLRELTGNRIEPCLVADDSLAALLGAYRPGRAQCTGEVAGAGVTVDPHVSMARASLSALGSRFPDLHGGDEWLAESTSH
jgi:Type II secretion system (T2SS), protein E, N-terminal domain